jgi:hypothetical protein
MKILIIGSGVVGSHLLDFFHNFQNKIEIDMLHSNNNHLYENSLFGSYHPIYRDAPGGFQNFWHRVFDLNGIKKKFIGKKFNFLNEYLGQNYEFIPYFKNEFKIKIPSQVSRKLHVNKIISSDKFGTKLEFSNKTIKFYNYVIICHGAIPKHDILVESKLANTSGFVSDHLIGETVPVNRINNLNTKNISIYGFLRQYEKFKLNGLTVKHTIRSHFGDNKSSLSGSIIYSKSKLDLIKKILGTGSFNIILNAFSTRYGFPTRSEYQKSFYQVHASNIYKLDNMKLTPIEARYKKLKDNLKKLNINGNLKSAIHYHNTYKNLDPTVSNRVFNKNKSIILISPQYDYNPGAHHFTADLLSTAENIIIDLLENNL